MKFSELVKLLEQNAFALVKERAPYDTTPSPAWTD
jgi:hypothetical protein